VGAEVAEPLCACSPRAAEAVRQEADGTWRADLWLLNRLLLEGAGVPGAQIEEMRLCTSCRAELFSHRRDHGSTGRQAGVIARSSPGARPVPPVS
jgi:copper oxidase (laccase) domain-containing protein